VGRVVTSTDYEHEITKRVAKRLSELLAGGYRLPLEVTRPSPVRHVTYPLYIAPDDSWSMTSVVWDVGRSTSCLTAGLASGNRWQSVANR